jgi:hypothetical protein
MRQELESAMRHCKGKVARREYSEQLRDRNVSFSTSWSVGVVESRRGWGGCDGWVDVASEVRDALERLSKKSTKEDAVGSRDQRAAPHARLVPDN